jgi:trans-aconitate methyltransferase
MAQHWNDIYGTALAQDLSWFETEPTTSLELFDQLHVSPHESVVDVGAGRSLLVDRLVARGFGDVTILDLSAAALRATKSRPGLEHVVALQADVATWEPPRRFDVWHDRAVLHFIEPAHSSLYVERLRAALSPGGKVIIGVFSPEGPDTCSGVRVTRYDAADLAQLLGEGFDIVAQFRRTHVTPWGVDQSFQWIAAVRNERPAAT